MATTKYRTTPELSTGMPPGIPYIIGNEAAERFSFYGMRGILVVFMTKHLLDASGNEAFMSDAEAKYYFHLFTSAVYFTPLLGALISDSLLGKYRTIIALSIVYCLGHLALALDDTRFGLAAGLTLIAIGAGGIKPCVSAHVGDQFGVRNQNLINKVFGWFYFSINLGAFISSLLTPYLLRYVGPAVAFGVPGVLMFVATGIFWLGRHKFVHIPPSGPGFVNESLGNGGWKSVLSLFALYPFVAMFWSLFDQTGSSWVLQAENMDLDWLGFKWEAAQIQAVNPILILVFIPLFSYVIYPAIDRVFPLNPLRKISIGLFLAAVPFAICAVVESRIEAGEQPHILWQVWAYAFLTAAEVMVSITCLEFSYTQAPPKMKSLIMSFYMLSVTAGNLFTAGVNKLLSVTETASPGEPGAAVARLLQGANYFWFFTAVIVVTAFAFIVVAKMYRGRTYIQGGDDPE